MNFDSKTTSGDPFYSSLKDLLKRKSGKLMQIFIQQGPDELRSRLAIKMDKHWQFVFDYLIFDRNVLKNCILSFMPFFRQMVRAEGPLILRKIFAIQDTKYDAVFEQLVDLVVVAEGLVYEYVYDNRKVFALRIMHGQAKDLRTELGINAAKYDSLWFQILEILQQTVCTRVYDNSVWEKGWKAFNMIYNSKREQRSLRSFKAMWSFESNLR